MGTSAIQSRSALRSVLLLFVLATSFVVAQEARAQLTETDIAAMKERAVAEGWMFDVSLNPAAQQPREQLCGAIPVSPEKVAARAVSIAAKADLPEAYDWHALNKCTPVRNQLTCGSCWAFAATAVMESNILINDNMQVDLSEQWLVSCNELGFDCVWGGNADCLYLFLPEDHERVSLDSCGDSGAILERDFPYQSNDAVCGCPYQHRYFINNCGYIDNAQANTDQIKAALVAYGPLDVSLYVGDAFQAYSGGIFNINEPGFPNHEVALVGYNDVGGYWIIKNSWGTGWGEAGYARIAYGKNNMCYTVAVMDYTGTPIEYEPGTGSLSVDLEPEAACTNGARWRVDDGQWQATGLIATGLSAGPHTVSFKSVSGWTKPEVLTVTVLNEQTTQASAAYAPFISLEDALDNTNEVWTTGGDSVWFGQAAISHDELDAAKTSIIDDGQFTYVGANLQGPGTLSFWWKVSSEQNYDKMLMYMDTTPQAVISGEVDWTQIADIEIPEGNHTVTWMYAKDSNSAGGQDRAWLDQVTYEQASINRYGLSLNVNPSSGGSIVADPAPDGDGLYAVGTVVTLTPSPQEGYQFSAWSGNLSGSANPATVTMTANQSVTATFVPLPPRYTLTLTADPALGGSVLADPAPDGDGKYEAGTTVVLTPQAGDGYQFGSWSGNLTGEASPAQIIMGGNRAVQAHFAAIPERYTLDFVCSPVGGGSIEADPAPDEDGKYEAGTTVTLTITEHNGYEFDSWSGDASGSDNPLQVTVEQDLSVQADFNQLEPMAAIVDAWWSDEVDLDGDGYVSAMNLCWDADVVGDGSLNVMEKIYWRETGTQDWNLVATTDLHSITGETDEDATSWEIAATSHSLGDYRIEIFRDGEIAPDDTIDSSDDADLLGHMEELASEDTEAALSCIPAEGTKSSLAGTCPDLLVVTAMMAILSIARRKS